jgi:hypothetical protein
LCFFDFFNVESKRTSRGTGVYASLFGVGAPEALVIGVVALLVFGPKGLAEVNSFPTNLDIIFLLLSGFLF